MASIVITSIGVASTGEAISTVIAPIAENAFMMPLLCFVWHRWQRSGTAANGATAYVGCGRLFDNESGWSWFGWTQRTIAANFAASALSPSALAVKRTAVLLKKLPLRD
jgi:hypothetical protein